MTMSAPELGADSCRDFEIEHLALPLWRRNEDASRRRKHQSLQVELALKSAGLTMVAVSAQSKVLYGEKSPYFIPRTFLYKQRAGVSPHLCQIAALSQITGCSFLETMKVCGFDLNMILALQLAVSNERTMIIAPYLSSHFPDSGAESLDSSNEQGYLYVKIGRRDATLCPAFPAGSIVRVIPSHSQAVIDTRCGQDSLWLVEHPNGISCCHVSVIAKDEIVLLPNFRRLSPWPLRVPTEARILGRVERPFLERKHGILEHALGTAFARGGQTPALPPKSEATISKLLRSTRQRTGLTFREAHAMTLQIAALLQDRTFGISVGLLSDYEAMNKLPRHIAKIISLCVIYGIDFWDLLDAANVRVNTSCKCLTGRQEPLSRKRVSGYQFPSQRVGAA